MGDHHFVIFCCPLSILSIERFQVICFLLLSPTVTATPCIKVFHPLVIQRSSASAAIELPLCWQQAQEIKQFGHVRKLH